jgi:hypothetical protein
MVLYIAFFRVWGDKTLMLICLLTIYIKQIKLKMVESRVNHDMVSWICNNSLPKENANSAIRSQAIHFVFHVSKKYVWWIKDTSH